MVQEFVTVGKLGRTRGVKGELYIVPLTDFPERFENITEILISSKEGWRAIKVAWSGFIGGRPVVKFEQVDTREDASRYTNRELGVPRDQLVKLPEDSYYIFELVGCLVYIDGSNELVGELVAVDAFPANDVYRIKTKEDKIILFPALKRFVKSIDIAAKKIVVDEAGIVT